MFTGDTDDNGFVSIKVAAGGSGFGGATAPRGDSAVCVHTDNDAAEITSFLTPDELCDFSTLELGSPSGSDPNSIFGGFESDVNVHLQTQDYELHALAEMTDAFLYVRDVINRKPSSARVMTGFNANLISPSTSVPPELRVWTPCFGFGSVVADVATLSAMGLGWLVGGPVGGVVAGAYFAILSTSDIMMPSVSKATHNREVMEHEYGHYALCTLIHDHAPGALNTLAIDAIGEGSDRDADAESGYLNEAFADFITGQTVSAADYKWLTSNTLDNGGRYCITPATVPGACWDANLSATNSFTAQIGRIATLEYDVFDGWTKGGPNDPTNADAWFLDATTTGCGGVNGSVGGSCLDFTPTAWGDTNDEPVALPGFFVQDWVSNFVGESNVFTALREKPLLTGLADTMKNAGVPWCDMCRVFALHASTFTPTQIQSLWATCRDNSTIRDMIGDPPDATLRLDVASCNVCGLHQISSPTGKCAVCAKGGIASNNACTACLGSTVPSGNQEVCQECGGAAIASGGVCVNCPANNIANHTTNACVPCPAGTTVLNNACVPSCVTAPVAASSNANGGTVALTAAQSGTAWTIDQRSPDGTYSNGQLCPGYLVEFTNMQLASFDDSTNLKITVSSPFAPPDPTTCQQSSTSVTTYIHKAGTDASGWTNGPTATAQGHWVDAVVCPGGTICQPVPAHCEWSVSVKLPKTGPAGSADKIRVQASASGQSPPPPGGSIFPAPRIVDVNLSGGPTSIAQ